MKQMITIILISMSLIACGNQEPPIISGDYVAVTEGQYEDCTGTIFNVENGWGELEMNNCLNKNEGYIINIRTNILERY